MIDHDKRTKLLKLIGAEYNKVMRERCMIAGILGAFGSFVFFCGTIIALIFMPLLAIFGCFGLVMFVLLAVYAFVNAKKYPRRG